MPKSLLRLPALSVNNSIVSFEVHKVSSITVIPLYCDKKHCHTFMSSRIACDTRMLWWGFLALHVASMSLLQKALPEVTTWHAKFNKPISDCNWRNEIFFECINIVNIRQFYLQLGGPHTCYIYPWMCLGFLCKSMYWPRRQIGNRPNNEEYFPSRFWFLWTSEELLKISRKANNWLTLP